MTGWFIVVFILGTVVGFFAGLMMASFAMANMIKKGELFKSDKF